MKETYKINTITLLLLSGIIIYTAFTLSEWNNEHLDPCCDGMCGRTTSMEECYPRQVSVYLTLIGFAIMGLGFFNLIMGDRK